MKRLLLFAATIAAAPSLFASADLSIRNSLTTTTVRAGSTFGVYYEIHNSGPDTASNVTATFTITGAVASQNCNAGCPIGDIPSGQSRSLYEQLTFPASNGDVTMTASVFSNTPDPNLADNNQTTTLKVSTDPDVYLAVRTPSPLDLGLPFPLSIFLSNSTLSDAHDVVVTVELPEGSSIKALPEGCTALTSTRLTCHVSTLPAGATAYLPAFVATIIAPTTYGSGSVHFSGVATERENDFDPASNRSSVDAQLYDTFYVTTTANDGSGSLRQAIVDANAACSGTPLCAIAFRISEASANGWKTIRVTTPLPALTAANIHIDGNTQAAFFGDTNPNGPEIEISGVDNVDGDGLLISGCYAVVSNLTVNGFGRNGVSVSRGKCPTYYAAELHHLFIGTDPTGSAARPNLQRGLGIAVPNGRDFNSATGPIIIHENVISGNALSGIFDLSGRVNIWGNRIGVKAHSDEPLPNGASGIFIGSGGYGSAIGPDVLYSQLPANVIAFNGETGVAVASDVRNVSIIGNSIWSNKLLGIDIGLDGPTISTKAEYAPDLVVPTLTLAHYDPVSKKTIIEAEAPAGGSLSLYANDSVDPSGYGEAQRPIGENRLVPFSTTTHYHFEIDGDLTGQFITATNTRVNYIGFAKPAGKTTVVTEGIDQGFLTQTSELSRAIEVR